MFEILNYNNPRSIWSPLFSCIRIILKINLKSQTYWVKNWPLDPPSARRDCKWGDYADEGESTERCISHSIPTSDEGLSTLISQTISLSHWCLVKIVQADN